MASVQKRGDKFQLRVVNKLLSKPYYDSFDTEEAARSYGQQLERLLEQGVVPLELLEAGPKAGPTMGKVIDNYSTNPDATPAQSDLDLLPVVRKEVATIRTTELTYQWVQGYVSKLKTEKNLTPGTIRKRVGLLARVLDWHQLHTTGASQPNSFRMLPRGYSLYTPTQAKLAPDGAKVDARRDRRLTKAELASVRSALSGVKRDDRERPLKHDPELEMLFELIHGTGARLFEAYRAEPGGFSFEKGWWRVEGSKGHRGVKKPRVVPLRPELLEKLRKFCEGRAEGEPMFSFWDGDPKTRKATQSRLTARFSTLFDYAKVSGFTEHDLRHSACCDWFEERNAQGHWTFSDVEIAKIMGWGKLDMVLLYASFRAEDLSARLAA